MGATGQSNLRDEELARMARAGCSSSFGVLLERYEARVFRFVRRWGLSSADAEDATQETFLSAWRGLRRYDDRRSFATWLFTIAARRASTACRSRRGQTPLDRAPEAAGAAPAEIPIAEGAAMWGLAQRLLSAEVCSALWLRHVESLSSQQIGRALGRSSVSVRVMLHRAHQTLARNAPGTIAERYAPTRRPLVECTP